MRDLILAAGVALISLLIFLFLVSILSSAVSGMPTPRG